MEPKVILKKKEFLVLEKPAGLLMHGLPNKKMEEPTVADWLRKNYPETARVGDEPDVRPGMVHRLDRDTSGVLVVARTPESFAQLKKLFEERKIRKTYLALVRGCPERERGVIAKPLGIRSGTTKRSVRSKKMSKEAVTEYRILEQAADEEGFKSSLLEVRPHTGRTHQIRVHLTSIGHPILGDPLYGPRVQPGWARRLMLHAVSLEFELDGRVFSVEAKPDKDFLKILKNAGIHNFPKPAKLSTMNL